MNFAMATLDLKLSFFGKCKKNLMFHFEGERHTSFPQKPVVEEFLKISTGEITSILSIKFQLTKAAYILIYKTTNHEFS